MHFLYFSLLIFSSLCFASCTNAQQNSAAAVTATDSLSEKILVFDSAVCGLRLAPAKNYAEAKAGIKTMKLKLKEKYLAISDTSAQKIFLDSAMDVFTHHLLNEII